MTSIKNYESYLYIKIGLVSRNFTKIDFLPFSRWFLSVRGRQCVF